MKKMAILIALSLSLQGCVFAVGAAAGATAVAAIYDHRKLESIANDQKTNNLALQCFTTIPGFKESAHVNVTTFDHVTLLTGETVTPRLREQAEGCASRVPGVSRVYNQIAIMGPSSSLSRTSDSWITTKIKTQMIGTKDLKSTTIKVVTENGIVYLMGSVSEEQAEIATDIARQTAGVQKVIRIFQYTNGAALATAQPSDTGESQNVVYSN